METDRKIFNDEVAELVDAARQSKGIGSNPILITKREKYKLNKQTNKLNKLYALCGSNLRDVLRMLFQC